MKRARILFKLWSVLAIAALFMAPGLAGSATAEDVPQAPDRTVRVMTYNIHHAEGTDDQLDLQRIAQIIQQENVDIVGLQEVDNHWSDRSNFLDEAKVLAGMLNMHYAYAANLDNDPLEPGQPRRQYGTAILSRFPILQSDNTLLPKLEGGEQRGLLETTINVRGIPLHFYNTHLQHNSPTAESGQAQRTMQVQKISEIIDGQEGPIVMTGDFNARPHTPELGPLYDLFNDSWELAGEGPGYSHPSSGPDRRIDYIWVSPDVQVSSIHVSINDLTAVGSDHLPVVATIRLPGEDVGVGN